MANGVWHTGYEIVVRLTHLDLGHPKRPGLLEEITRLIGAGTGSYSSAWNTTKTENARPKVRAEPRGRQTAGAPSAESPPWPAAHSPCDGSDDRGVRQAQGDEGTHCPYRPGARPDRRPGGQ